MPHNISRTIFIVAFRTAPLPELDELKNLRRKLRVSLSLCVDVCGKSREKRINGISYWNVDRKLENRINIDGLMGNERAGEQGRLA